MRRAGRPQGLLINPDAAHQLLGDRPQAWLAAEAGVSPAHLSDLLSGNKRASSELADRIADALGANTTGVVFPERVGFAVSVFIATGEDVTP